jgi:hypothetical protein
MSKKNKKKKTKDKKSAAKDGASCPPSKGQQTTSRASAEATSSEAVSGSGGHQPNSKPNVDAPSADDRKARPEKKPRTAGKERHVEGRRNKRSNEEARSAEDEARKRKRSLLRRGGGEEEAATSARGENGASAVATEDGSRLVPAGATGSIPGSGGPSAAKPKNDAGDEPGRSSEDSM